MFQMRQEETPVAGRLFVEIRDGRGVSPNQSDYVVNVLRTVADHGGVSGLVETVQKRVDEARPARRIFDLVVGNLVLLVLGEGIGTTADSRLGPTRDPA